MAAQGTPQPGREANWQAQAGIGTYGAGGDRAGWAAYLVFAAVMLCVVGVFAVLQGLTALLDEDFYAVTRRGLVVSADFEVWGWFHLALGVVAVLTGWGLTLGTVFARLAGITVAVLVIMANLAFLPAYPWWSVLMIAFNVLVIYAITVHGDEVRTAR
ncbi:hypothetical protein ACI8AC_20835 [Geodermatophilus sp. SYSU D00758]